MKLGNVSKFREFLIYKLANLISRMILGEHFITKTFIIGAITRQQINKLEI